LATPKHEILIVMANADGVRVGDAGHTGRGVFTAEPFRAGERILGFQGRVVHRQDLAGLTTWEREHLGEVTAETYQVLPEPRCYLNHACAPNAVSTLDAVYARRDIAVGEEITIDYRLNAHDDGDVWEMTCRCEAFAGEHVVRGDFFSLPAAVQEEYVVDAPAFIQEAYRRRRSL
jgi:hypothetical protein